MNYGIFMLWTNAVLVLGIAFGFWGGYRLGKITGRGEC